MVLAMMAEKIGRNRDPQAQLFTQPHQQPPTVLDFKRPDAGWPPAGPSHHLSVQAPSSEGLCQMQIYYLEMQVSEEASLFPGPLVCVVFKHGSIQSLLFFYYLKSIY